jgi:nicotinate dehydrogenase subunit A
MTTMTTISLNVNGATHELDVESGTPLLYVLRNDLGLKSAKYGCGLEQCGACKVLVDGEALCSCSTPAESFAGRSITTLEGIGSRNHLHPLQQAFIAERAAQCGYCVTGMIIAAKALLDRNPAPDDQAIATALQDHLCRCGTHPRIIRAIKRAALALETQP